MSKKNNNIEVLSSNWDFKKISKSSEFNPNSKQVEDELQYSVTVVEYDTSPKLLSVVAKNSFIIDWTTKKVIWWVNTKLNSNELNNNELKKWNKIKNKIVKYWVKNIYINWNAWFEVIKNIWWEIIDVLPIVTDTIRLLPWWEGAIQKIWADEVYFNIFEWNKDVLQEKIQAYKETWARKNELVANKINWKIRTWYNPNLNDVILIKEININSKYYWVAKQESCIDQVLLLKYIDDYFINFFEKWTMKVKALYDKSWKMTSEDKKLLKELFKQKASGAKNAFNSLFVSWDLWEINLDSDIDAKQFTDMRWELRRDILVDLEIPYDLLYTDNSNKAISQSSKENFYDYTITPFQSLFEEVLNELLQFEKENAEIFFTKTNVKDIFEEAKILVSMKTTWIITTNEARELSNYELWNIEWWDMVENNWNQDLSAIQKEELIKSLQI